MMNIGGRATGNDGGLLIGKLRNLDKRPTLFEPGEPLFWDDPHISSEMLKAHLDPEIDAASRKPATIDLTCDWLVGHFRLRPGDRVLDLGCGPGLYTSRLAKRGLKVTGIDYSRRQSSTPVEPQPSRDLISSTSTRTTLLKTISRVARHSASIWQP